MLDRLPSEAVDAAIFCDGAVHTLYRDIETRSRAILKTVGVHRYAADASTEVLCVAYAANDDPVQLWTPGDPVPMEFIRAANSSNWLAVAHNVTFEMAIEKQILVPRYVWPQLPLERQRCTMAAALALGLPARLDRLAVAFELANHKNAAGQRLMHQMSKPRRAHKDEDPACTHWFDDQERFDRLCAYCVQDVETERELYERLPPLSPSEQAIWELSCKINARGFCVNQHFAEAARKIAQAAAPEIDQELAEITGGAVRDQPDCTPDSVAAATRLYGRKAR